MYYLERFYKEHLLLNGHPSSSIYINSIEAELTFLVEPIHVPLPWGGI